MAYLAPPPLNTIMVNYTSFSFIVMIPVFIGAGSGWAFSFGRVFYYLYKHSPHLAYGGTYPLPDTVVDTDTYNLTLRVCILI